MKHHCGFLSGFALLVLFGSADLFSQPKFVTFNQEDLSFKKVKARRIAYIVGYYGFVNTTGDTAKGIHILFNKRIENGLVEFAGVTVHDDNSIDARYGSVAPSDTAHLVIFKKKLQVLQWWWTDENGNKLGPTQAQVTNGTYDWSYTVQPNGGNVLEYLYKKIIRRPAGLVIGIPQLNRDSAKIYGWIRYLAANRLYFPHLTQYDDPGRMSFPGCFDHLLTSTGLSLSFHKELRNPHAKKHRNHLLGEVHALKLAIIANDYGVTEPTGGGTALFGDLLYNDTTTCDIDAKEYSGDDPSTWPSSTWSCWGNSYSNGKTIRQITQRADSMLTYCHRFTLEDYVRMDKCISRLNLEFWCSGFTALSLNPLVLQGCRELPHYLSASSPSGPRSIPDFTSTVPNELFLYQNYPNPFNPITTIEFSLIEPAVVSLKVYSALGEEVATLLESEPMEEGIQYVDFDANALASGIYFYRLSVQSETRGQFQATNRMVLLK